MNQLKTYILRQVAAQQLGQDEARNLLLELANANTTAAPAPSDKKIAIIGMAGRFPQADSAEAFWQQLRDGLNCIVDYPKNRQQDIEAILKNPYYLEYLTGNAVTLKNLDQVFAPAGYMQEVDKFDAAFFGIPPNEATYMDPNQRLALEVAWEAMEDAGYGGETLFGTDTGVYLGREGTNVAFYRFNSKKDPMQLTGSWESIIASRISYLFDLRGPSMLVDTACSSSLVSVHLACKAILSGECALALAGGVNLVHGELKADLQGGMNMSSVESADNVIRTFDANANGTVWGEGVAMVLLKPLAQALADGDHIHAVIDGSAINNDGASNALTAPNAETQEAVIVKAWQDAGIHPEQLGYIEAHGTGTVLGDPIEFKALTNAFRRFTNKTQFCAIGSLKTNMGHLVASSGVASLFKVVKSLQHQQLAPTINFQQPNPYINFATSPLYVNDKLSRWAVAEHEVRRAGISSFGFNHTNCHLVVSEAPARPALAGSQAQYCLMISAKKASVLRDYVLRYQQFVSNADFELADLCYTAAVGRGHYPHRICLLARDKAELQQRLAQALTALDGQFRAGIICGSFTLISEKKTQRQSGDLTERERRALSEQAQACLTEYLQQQQPELLSQLAAFYCRGADVNWAACYANERRQRLSQPVYPLERVRYWADSKITEVAGYSQQLHPLVDRLVSKQQQPQGTEWLFETVLANETHWVLADHKIKGTGVVPGTTYLEMARVVAKEALGWQQLELAGVFFLQPLVVSAGEQRLLQIRVQQSADSSCSFVMRSRSLSASGLQTVSLQTGSLQTGSKPGYGDDDDSDWQQHVEGQLLPLSPADLAGQAQPDLGYLAVQQAASQVIDTYLAEADTGVFQFGPHWDTVRSVWHAAEQTLARLALPDTLAGELDNLSLHPSMLDNAMNLVSQQTGATYLPFMYKSLKIYRPFCNGMYSRVIANQPLSIDAETHSYDVVMTAADGQLLAVAQGYITKKVHSFDFSQPTGNDFVAMRWAPLAWPDGSDPAFTNAGQQVDHRPVLLIGAQDGAEAASAQLAQLWQQQGVPVQLVTLCTDAATQAGQFSASAEGIAALLDSLGLQNSIGLQNSVGLPDGVGSGSSAPLPFQRIVWACNLTPLPVAALLQVEAAPQREQLSIQALFLLAKALLARKIRLPLHLLSAAAYAPDLSSAPAYCNPLAAASALFGLTLAMETAGLPCQVLDVDASRILALPEHAASVYQLLLALPAGKIISWQPTGLYQQVLGACSLPAAATPWQVHADGVYLITGGLGGLGLAAAAELATRQPAARVVLVGRSALAPAAEWAALAQIAAPVTTAAPAEITTPAISAKQRRQYATLALLSQRLALLEYQQLDVTDSAAVSSLVSALTARFGRVNGVFHTAGVAGDGFVLRKDAATFNAVLAAKLQGSLNLLAALAPAPRPDFISLYSSITGLLGGEGQADYAAANAFLDALVAPARALGLPVHALNWPSWQETGMSVDYQLDTSMTPFQALTNAQAFSALEQVLLQLPSAAAPAVHAAYLVPADINPVVFRHLTGQLVCALDARLQAALTERPLAKANSAVGSSELQILGKSEDELSPTELTLARIYAAVLGVSEIDLFANFQDLGGNSIIATHLLKVIEGEFPGLADISDIFSYPSVDVMAEYLARKQQQAGATVRHSQPQAAPEQNWDALMDSLTAGEQSVDDVLARL